jgi:hypothetical protein
MAKKAAAQNGRADLPVSQDAQQRFCGCLCVMAKRLRDVCT